MLCCFVKRYNIRGAAREGEENLRSGTVKKHRKVKRTLAYRITLYVH